MSAESETSPSARRFRWVSSPGRAPAHFVWPGSGVATRAVSLPRLALPWRRLLAGAVATALLVPNSSVLEHRAIIAVFLLALITGRGWIFARDWLPLIGAAALFVLLRQFAAFSPLPHQGETIARAEAALFGGTTPTTWLQARFYTPGRPDPLAYAATAVHASYFFGFVVVGLGIWLAARHHFRRYTLTLAMTFALGLVGYALLPAEPPWLVARQGVAAPAVRILGETARGTRLTSDVVAGGLAWQDDPDALGDPNPTAAMPSVHTAVTVALALFLGRRRRSLGLLGAAYALAMAFSLVYLGEHFLLDVLAGVACALAAAWLVERPVGDAAPRPRPSPARAPAGGLERARAWR